eukprot:6471220-Amphidinium_carterae.1
MLHCHVKRAYVHVCVVRQCAPSQTCSPMISKRCALQGPLWSPAASNAPTFGLRGPPATRGPNPTS